MNIQSLHFINRYPVIRSNPVSSTQPWRGSRQEVEWVFAQVDFRLGLGPCGKVVTDLSAYQTENIFTIHQIHADGTSKDFIYQMSDIAGRIVVEYTEEQENV